MTSRQRMNKLCNQCNDVMDSMIQSDGSRLYMRADGLEELRWLYEDIGNAEILVLVKKSDIPSALDFDAFLALLDMMNGAALLLDADGNMRQLAPQLSYV